MASVKPALRTKRGGDTARSESKRAGDSRADGTPREPSASDARKTPSAGRIEDGTAIARCVRDELTRYFDVLDGEPPADLYRAVMRQAEAALLRSVLDECRGNQSRAASWLGISRGTLRGKLTDLGIR